MEYLFEKLPSLRKRLAGGCVVMLDFDGVLAPIVEKPKDARMPLETRALVRRLLKYMPIVIISGRSLRDVKRRVGIPGVIYAGSHGLEWEWRGRTHAAPASEEAKGALTTVQRTLKAIARRFEGVSMESKPGSVALNYRALSLKDARTLRRDAKAIIRPHVRPGVLRVLDHNRTFDAVLDVNWTKGHCAAALFHDIERESGLRRTPVYIGDSLTDEDAFKIFKTGITIRVKKNVRSAARYFVRNRKGVDRFLSLLEQEVVGDE